MGCVTTLQAYVWHYLNHRAYQALQELVKQLLLNGPERKFNNKQPLQKDLTAPLCIIAGEDTLREIGRCESEQIPPPEQLVAWRALVDRRGLGCTSRSRSMIQFEPPRTRYFPTSAASRLGSDDTKQREKKWLAEHENAAYEDAELDRFLQNLGKTMDSATGKAPATARTASGRGSQSGAARPASPAPRPPSSGGDGAAPRRPTSSTPRRPATPKQPGA